MQLHDACQLRVQLQLRPPQLRPPAPPVPSFAPHAKRPAPPPAMSDITPRFRATSPKTLGPRNFRPGNRPRRRSWLLALATVIQAPTESAREVERERDEDRHFLTTEHRRSIALPYNVGMPKRSVTSHGASNDAVPAAVKVSRKQAAGNADGLLRAEGLQMSPEHQALSARWVAGEVDGAELERLGLELVRQRLASAAVQ